MRARMMPIGAACVALLLMSCAVFAAKMEATPVYVGTAGCSCHRAEIAVWELDRHGKAFDSLGPGKRKAAKRKVGLDPDKDYSGDHQCLICHATGLGRAGGYRDARTTPELKGVGCEMCHGPGSVYRILHDQKRFGFSRQEAAAAGQTYATGDAAVCAQCHNHRHSPYNETVDARYRDDWMRLLEDRPIYHAGP